MNRTLIALAVIAALGGIPAAAQTPPTVTAETPATPVATGYSVETTKIGVLLDTPALKTIFEDFFPDIVANPDIEQGREMTLPDIVQYAPDILTPDKLAKMDTALKAVPPQ
jgi:hypothetical protein